MATNRELSVRILDVTGQLAAGSAAFSQRSLRDAERVLVSAWMTIFRIPYDCQVESAQRTVIEALRRDILDSLGAVEASIGTSLRRERAFLDAAKYALRAAKRFRQAGQLHKRALALENAANSYLEMNRADRAEPLYRSCLDIFQVLNDDKKGMEVNGTLQQFQATPLRVLLDRAKALNYACVSIEKLLNKGRLEEALNLTERVLAEAPDCAAAWDVKGRCLQRMDGGLQEALKCHQKSVECDATDAVSLRNLAFCFDATGKYGMALKVICEAIDLAPEEGQIACSCALYLMKCVDQGEISEDEQMLFVALMALDDAVEFAPQWALSYAIKADVLIRLNVIEAAQDALQKGRAAGLEESTATVIAQAIIDAGRPKRDVT